MIKAIFLSEFHYEKGPEITFFHPAGSKFESIVRENFTEFNYFVCPSDHLTDRLLSLRQNEKYILIGWPHTIISQNYLRNKIQYNTNIVALYEAMTNKGLQRLLSLDGKKSHSMILAQHWLNTMYQFSPQFSQPSRHPFPSTHLIHPNYLATSTSSTSMLPFVLQWGKRC